MREWRTLAPALVLLATISSDAAPLSGTVRTTVRAGTTPAQAVVYAEPLDRAVPPKPVRVALTQKGKTFTPDVLGIPVGSTVEFPNEDAIFHNVFSLSPPIPFDLGLYRAGSSKSRSFLTPATYRVFCNIHPQMTALVFVVPTPFVTVTSRDGAFSLDLPPGSYRVTVVSGRSVPAVKEVSVPSAGTRVEGLELDERAFADEPHKNKFGKDYPRAAYRQ